MSRSHCLPLFTLAIFAAATALMACNYEDEANCTVEENDDGEATIYCPDGSSTTIRDGADGEDGTSCYAEEGDGTTDIVCEDGGEFTVPGGDCDTFEGNFAVANTIDLTLFKSLGCSEIDGDLIVSSNALTGLDGMTSLQQVHGDLRITNNDKLQRLDGLDNLTFIDGDLTIRDNPDLQDGAVFDNVEEVRGDITITDNDSLEDISGFDQLQIAGSLLIQDLPELLAIDGFDALQQLNGPLRIERNHTLVSITGFSSLETNYHQEFVDDKDLEDNGDDDDDNGEEDLPDDHHLIIAWNSSLETIDGFDALHQVYGRMEVTFLRELTELPAFNALVSTHGALRLHDLPELETIDGFDALEDVDGTLTLGTGFTTASSLTDDARQIVESWEGFDDDWDWDDTDDRNAIDDWIEESGLFGAGELQQLTGFDELTEVDGMLEIRNHEQLEQIPSFSSLETIDGALRIGDNEELLQVSGFDDLTDTGGSVEIRDNNQLESVPSFSSLETIGGRLRIVGNGELQEIDGFNALEEIGSISSNAVHIADNPELISITGFLSGPTATVSPFFGTGTIVTIDSNLLLEDISGLGNFDSFENTSTFSSGSIRVIDNPSLDACHVEDTFDNTGFSGTLTNQDNDGDDDDC